MTSKQIIVSVILFVICNNNVYAMDHYRKNDDDNEFCYMTCHRPSGYWDGPGLNPSIKVTSKEDQREPWHQLTCYVAEPLCALSSIPLYLVTYAVKNSHPLSAAALAFAGTSSAISHAIPYQFLNNIDKIGALACVAAVAHDTNIHNPTELAAALHNQKIALTLAAVTAVKLTDFWVARSKQIVKNSSGLLSEKLIVARKPEHQWIHVLWHLLAAWTAYTLLTSC